MKNKMMNKTMNYETYITEKINKIAYNRFFQILPKKYLEEFTNRYVQQKRERDLDLRKQGVEDCNIRNNLIIHECTDLEKQFKTFEKEYVFRFVPTRAFA